MGDKHEKIFFRRPTVDLPVRSTQTGATVQC